jgi:hypothetical protein
MTNTEEKKIIKLRLQIVESDQIRRKVTMKLNQENDQIRRKAEKDQSHQNVSMKDENDQIHRKVSMKKEGDRILPEVPMNPNQEDDQSHRKVSMKEEGDLTRHLLKEGSIDIPGSFFENISLQKS